MGVVLPGIGVSRGYAVGRARLWHHGEPEVLEAVLPDHYVEDEVARFERALRRAKAQLRQTRERISTTTPPEILEFFDAHLLMLEDSALTVIPVEIIRNRRCNAEWALKIQQEALVAAFDRMDDEYLKTRRDDVIHVVTRVLRELQRETSRYESEIATQVDESLVILAQDLLPEDLVLLHHMDVAAIVTEHGGPLSHTAILARSLGIPAVVGAPRISQYIREGETVVVDGHHGMLLADLPEADLEYFSSLQEALRRRRMDLEILRSEPALTADGVPITLRGNIELPEDLKALNECGAEGVGLYRTEFLYMNRAHPPDEEEQYTTYVETLSRLHGQPLTIRTLDAGADKVGRLAGAESANPALGLRAVRLCLKERGLFRTQLRAVLRASASGPIRLMVPMITSVSELHQVRQLIESVRAELDAEGFAHDPRIPIGAMIEVPAAALCADLFARELDFLSIGTNDLIQYTLATDRLDENVNHLYDPLHPAVLRLLASTVNAGRAHNVPVALCGEMAADPELTRLLLGIGLGEFSVPPAMLLEVKQIIRSSTMQNLREQVAPLLECADPERIRDHLTAINHQS